MTFPLNRTIFQLDEPLQARTIGVLVGYVDAVPVAIAKRYVLRVAFVAGRSAMQLDAYPVGMPGHQVRQRVLFAGIDLGADPLGQREQQELPGVSGRGERQGGHHRVGMK